MPSVETPDVEPEPRDKTKHVFDEKTNKFLPKKYVEDNQYLQFKWLSVLSSNTDTEIVEGLRKFADSYQIWIKQLDAAGNSIGRENITKCEKDYQRIKNNIDEFLTNPD